MNPFRMGAVALGLAAGIALVAGGGGPPANAQGKQIQIGTGGVTGVYYPAGNVICQFFNRTAKDLGYNCRAPSTGGSVYNLNALRSGDLDFGVVQSDWQAHAYEGTSDFESQGAFDGLRSVFSLHPEPVTVVARADSGIETFQDLKGKRVNLGNPGSGQRATMDVLLDALGWTTADFSLASELKSSEQAQALADNKIDAFVFTVGHPSGSIEEAVSTVDARIIPVTGPEIDGLVENNPYYAKATIPGGMYRGTEEDVDTFGVRATLVTTADTPDDVVYTLAKAVFENFDRFQKQHDAFQALNKEEMVREALTAPLHPGAEKYYQEAGLLTQG
ncbi:MAG TPA: TAXI family TRAP transporter solute-binding subunit [Geminicoccaceae bacterium]|nr:TAXI family TRAP transporter solute-binding subunit [Geminicoccaceae bacterium]